MNTNHKTLLTLFTTTFVISAFTFGGGYVIVTMMKKKFVDQLGWLSENEMLEITAVAQSAPGVIAVNTSILLGYNIAGVPGACMTILGTVLPPVILLSVISVFYDSIKDLAAVSALLRGMQAAIAAVICDVVLSMGIGVAKKKQVFPMLIMAAAFICTFIFKINVAYIILASGIIGGATAWIRKCMNRENGGA